MPPCSCSSLGSVYHPCRLQDCVRQWSLRPQDIQSTARRVHLKTLSSQDPTPEEVSMGWSERLGSGISFSATRSVKLGSFPWKQILYLILSCPAFVGEGNVGRSGLIRYVSVCVWSRQLHCVNPKRQEPYYIFPVHRTEFVIWNKDTYWIWPFASAPSMQEIAIVFSQLCGEPAVAVNDVNQAHILCWTGVILCQISSHLMINQSFSVWKRFLYVIAAAYTNYIMSSNKLFEVKVGCITSCLFKIPDARPSNWFNNGMRGYSSYLNIWKYLYAMYVCQNRGRNCRN